jgi:hypothetical protein
LFVYSFFVALFICLLVYIIIKHDFWVDTSYDTEKNKNVFLLMNESLSLKIRIIVRSYVCDFFSFTSLTCFLCFVFMDRCCLSDTATDVLVCTTESVENTSRF